MKRRTRSDPPTPASARPPRVPAPPDVTTLLGAWRGGDREAYDVLFSLVYEELGHRARRALRRESRGHDLTTVALVHETYLKLAGVARIDWQNRAHFLAVAATAMRRILVSEARRHRALKRGAGAVRISLDEAVPLATERAGWMLALDVALDRLAERSDRMARTVELRFFGGLTIEETAEVLGVAASTVQLDWQKARAWLYRELAD